MTALGDIEIEFGEPSGAPDVLPVTGADRQEPLWRLSVRAPRRAAAIAASLALHAGLSFTLDYYDQARDQTQTTSEQEIPVEVVSEIPGEKPHDSGSKSEQAPAAAQPPDTQANQANAAPPAAAQPDAPAKPVQTARAAQPPLEFPKPSPGPQSALPPLALLAPQRNVAPPPQSDKPQTGTPRAAVEVAPVVRPDVAPTARDTPPPPSLGKPSADEIEHLFLPDLFKIVAADTSPVASKEEADSYKAVVFDRIIRGRQYPDGARRRGAHGVAVVSLVIDSAGNLGGVSVIRSAGDRELDAEAIAMVRRAAPFPPPPPGSVLSFTPLIEFGLE